MIPEPTKAPVTQRSAESEIDDALDQLLIVTVTYNPDPEILARQLAQLPEAAIKIGVDNASQSELLRAVQASYQGPRRFLLQNPTNVGLAAALNQGVAYAEKEALGCRYVLFLDQDTEPQAGNVEKLLRAFLREQATRPNLGSVGPALVDAKTALPHGFHRIVGWRWVREYPAENSTRPVSCTNLNGSGTLMTIDRFKALGGFEESFFIDHVDTEWAFRILAAGYVILGIPDVAFMHRMGEDSLKYWFFRWRVWPSRSPGRHYFLFRNAIVLLGRSSVPAVWKFWAVIKLFLTFVVTAGFSHDRTTQIVQMGRGIKDAGHRRN